MAKLKKDFMKALYNKAKDTKVNQKMKCPGCGKEHIKTSYQKVFCSNKGPGNCKDKFWNKVDPNKRCRDTPYFRDVIMGNMDSYDDYSFPSMELDIFV